MHQGRLSRTVVSRDTDFLPSSDLQVHSIQDRALLGREVQPQIIHLQVNVGAFRQFHGLFSSSLFKFDIHHLSELFQSGEQVVDRL